MNIRISYTVSFSGSSFRDWGRINDLFDNPCSIKCFFLDISRPSTGFVIVQSLERNPANNLNLSTSIII